MHLLVTIGSCPRLVAGECRAPLQKSRKQPGARGVTNLHRRVVDDLDHLMVTRDLSSILLRAPSTGCNLSVKTTPSGV